MDDRGGGRRRASGRGPGEPRGGGGGARGAGPGGERRREGVRSRRSAAPGRALRRRPRHRRPARRAEPAPRRPGRALGTPAPRPLCTPGGPPPPPARGGPGGGTWAPATSQPRGSASGATALTSLSPVAFRERGHRPSRATCESKCRDLDPGEPRAQVRGRGPTLTGGLPHPFQLGGVPSPSTLSKRVCWLPYGEQREGRVDECRLQSYRGRYNRTHVCVHARLPTDVRLHCRFVRASGELPRNAESGEGPHILWHTEAFCPYGVDCRVGKRDAPRGVRLIGPRWARPRSLHKSNSSSLFQYLRCLRRTRGRSAIPSPGSPHSTRRTGRSEHPRWSFRVLFLGPVGTLLLAGHFSRLLHEDEPAPPSPSALLGIPLATFWFPRRSPILYVRFFRVRKAHLLCRPVPLFVLYREVPSTHTDLW